MCGELGGGGEGVAVLTVVDEFGEAGRGRWVRRCRRRGGRGGLPGEVERADGEATAEHVDYLHREVQV